MTITDKMAVFNSISNPECKPLEELSIKTYVNGQLKDIPALDGHWVNQGKIFVQYFPPLLNDQNCPYPTGAKEDWLERMSYFHADMKWLLSLNHHRFWSQIVIGDDSLIGIESFLQEATPFYVTKSFPNDSKMIEEYKIAQHLVFLVLLRISTQKESKTEWIGSKKLGQLWYDKYLITLPMLLDMCLLYGQSNSTELSKMFKRIFEIQPLYNEDVKNALVFIDERLRMVQEKFSSKRSNESNLPLKLIDQNNSVQSAKKSEFTLISLSDMILYVLDTAVNLTSFLSVHQPACALFHSFRFETRIVSLYENTIPKMFQELDFLLKKEDTIDVYFDIKFKLDLARHELIKLFRYSSYSTICTLFESTGNLSEEEIKSCVEDFISVLSEFLSDKIFIQDYNKVYPVDLDLHMLSQICPDLDSIKRDFLIESVLSCYDVPKLKSKQDFLCSSSGSRMVNDYVGPSNLTNGTISKKVIKGVQLKSLVSEVKDIMPHLGEGFVQKCLEYYDYNSASVINAILENSLPEPLECLDMEMAADYDDNNEKSIEVNGLPERANVFDNDEFDIMTQDYVDTSKIHKGKWKLRHKNFNEMLNDKSHIGQLKESYSRLGIVVDEVDVLYEDEYDDTYDGLDVSVKEPDEPERRPFVTPRVLQTSSSAHDNCQDYEESEKEDDEEESRNRDNFVENPEVVRARLAHQRQLKQFNRGSKPPPSRDVVGKPKGQGQDNNVLRNRDYKHSHKSSFANHNRRSGAQRKRNQGMMPS